MRNMRGHFSMFVAGVLFGFFMPHHHAHAAEIGKPETRQWTVCLDEKFARQVVKSYERSHEDAFFQWQIAEGNGICVEEVMTLTIKREIASGKGRDGSYAKAYEMEPDVSGVIFYFVEVK
jgi:hypothetical protein